MKNQFRVPIVLGAFAIAAGILLIGCGGGGGGGGGTGSGGSNGGGGTIRAEAALAASPDVPIDPLNIQAGETVQFQVVSYNAGKTVRTILASSNWTTTDNGNNAGILNSDGTFTATAPTGATKYDATGTANSINYMESYRVKPIQALVTGVIRDSNNLPADHVVIVFFNNAGAEVSRAFTQYDGTFRCSTPTSATNWSLDPAWLPKSVYFRSFVYQTVRYSTLIDSCTVTAPPLTNGVTTSIGSIVIDAAKTNGQPNPPPPPPDGCV